MSDEEQYAEALTKLAKRECKSPTTTCIPKIAGYT